MKNSREVGHRLKEDGREKLDHMDRLIESCQGNPRVLENLKSARHELLHEFQANRIQHLEEELEKVTKVVDKLKVNSSRSPEPNRPSAESNPPVTPKRKEVCYLARSALKSGMPRAIKNGKYHTFGVCGSGGPNQLEQSSLQACLDLGYTQCMACSGREGH